METTSGLKGSQSTLTWQGQPVAVDCNWIILRKNDEPAAEIFYTYYRRETAKSTKAPRPITFVMNGGPGAASAYLHLGGLGPRRINFEPSGALPRTQALLDNAESWIAFTDLVFVDPTGTGFSQVAKKNAGKRADLNSKPDGSKNESSPLSSEGPSGGGERSHEPLGYSDGKPNPDEFYRLKRDLESLGEFVERFLSQHKLWDAPVYLVGESYGGYRVAKLARRLPEQHGVHLSGIVAVSPALEWNLLLQSDYEILSYVDVFCSMALAAQFHGRSRTFAKDLPLSDVRRQIETFATEQLGRHLVRHQEVDSESFYQSVADMLGLDLAFVRRCRGRISFAQFARELLRESDLVLGAYDASMTAVDPFPDRNVASYPDPSLAAILPLFTFGINHLLRKELGINTDRIYTLLSEEVNAKWKRDEQPHVFETSVGATDDLRYGISLNRHLKVLICHGYFDLVTPYFSADRLVSQMRLTREQATQVSIRHFQGGHMFYSWEKSRCEFRDWAKSELFKELNP